VREAGEHAPLLFGRRPRVPPCPSLWADVCPPHDGRVYASVFVVILQGFPCTSAPCLAGGLGLCATPGPPAPGGRRLAPAGPREPGAPSAVLPGRSHAHPPVHDHAARSWHGRPHEARDGRPVAARTRAQHLSSRRQHTTPAAARAGHGDDRPRSQPERRAPGAGGAPYTVGWVRTRETTAAPRSARGGRRDTRPTRVGVGCA